MKETISWTKSGQSTRIAVVELCGWCSEKGEVTASGRRIARTEWEALTPAARTVLTRHGILP